MPYEPTEEDLAKMVAQAKSPNAKRGLRIADTNYVYLDEGAYGAIFVDKIAKRVRKVYWKKTPRDQACPEFESENDAYSKACATMELEALVPQLHGKPETFAVIDGDGTNVSNEFYLDFTLELDFIEGEFRKIGEAGADERKRIMDLFMANGVHYVSDASAIIEDGKIVKVIDFGIKENVPKHVDIGDYETPFG